MKSKVAILKCTEYDPDKIYSALQSGFQLLGGVENFIKSGEKVLLKVNLIGAWKPEKAITTHPAVVEALCRIITELKALPVIGDSSGGSYFGMTERALKTSGMENVARKTQAMLANFDEAGLVKISHPDSFEILESIEIAKSVLDADKIISVAKLKTHMATFITGAVKNMFGAVPGPKKAEIHRRFSSLEEFACALVDIYSVVKPHLAVVDGIVGMEGNGPSAGTPKEMGIVLLGADSVAVDAVMAEICRISPQKVNTITFAERRGLGQGCMEGIDVVGGSLEEAKVAHFEPPITYGLLNNTWIPESLKNLIGRFFITCTAPKPSIIKKNCVRCELCVKSCPIGAITLKNNVARIDKKQCISCFCCQELCPHHAVKIDVHWSWRLSGL